MALPSLFTDAQLEIAVGGAPNLIRLAKASGPSDAVYSTFKAELRDAANSDVYSVVASAFATSDPTVQQAALLAQLALPVAAYWAHIKGSGGQEVPQGVTDSYDRSQRVLGEIRDGKRSLGTDTEPASAAPAHLVDMDATGPSGLPGSGWTRANWGGYC